MQSISQKNNILVVLSVLCSLLGLGLLIYIVGYYTYEYSSSTKRGGGSISDLTKEQRDNITFELQQKSPPAPSGEERARITAELQEQSEQEKPLSKEERDRITEELQNRK